MNNLKPFAFISDRERDDFASPAMVACCPYETAEMRNALYAIPSTHRVVSVELLERLSSHLDVFTNDSAIEKELRAIIDNTGDKGSGG